MALAYDRNRPEKTILHEVVTRTWPRIVSDYAVADKKMPYHVVQEMENYLKCGMLEFGFIHLACSDCGKERILGYSCKKRGYCPRCGARRREQTADRIENEVWPTGAGARQWVLTFPPQIRAWLANSPLLFGDVINVVTDRILYYYASSATGFLSPNKWSRPAGGAISFIQRYGSSLTRNPHLHIIFLDGAWVKGPEGLQFEAHRGFSTESMFAVIEDIYRHVFEVFKDHGYVREDGEGEAPEEYENMVHPFCPRASKAFRRKSRLAKRPDYHLEDPDRISVEGFANIRYKYFSLHAAVKIEGPDREGLKNLLRYAARSAVNLTQLSYVTPEDPSRSEIELEMKRDWKDGTRTIIFSQTNLVESLAALTPPPWFNMVRYHGLFAPNHAWRSFAVPMPKRRNVWSDQDDKHKPALVAPAGSVKPPPEYWIRATQLMFRSLGINPEICSCGGRMKVKGSVTDATSIAEILTRLDLVPTGPPPKSVGELEIVYDI